MAIKSKLTKILINLVVLALTVVTIFVFGEITLRSYHYYKYGINILNGANNGLVIKDDKLGWKMAKNLSFGGVKKDALGDTYNVSFETDKNGFRLCGDPQSTKLKIFFVGDSFTEAIDVSNAKTYYGLIGERLKNIEIFAYGVGGYSSLQEFLILDEIIDWIKPNIIVWQFHEGDFLENDNKLDMFKSFYNTGVPRPYMDITGKITNRYAVYKKLFVTLPYFISENFRLLKYINKQLSVAINSQLMTNDKIAELKEVPKEFEESTFITQLIMFMAKERAGKVPIYLFCITDRQPFYNAIKEICHSTGIVFVDSVPRNLKKWDIQKPYVTRASDKMHLNEFGNRVLAESLIDFFEENKITK